MPTEVILPKVDMDMATGRISRWLAEDGARVEKGAVLFEIETDKAAMEIDAPASGTLRITAPRTGCDIAVGTPVAWILAEGEALPAQAPAPAGIRADAPAGASGPLSEAPSAKVRAADAVPDATAGPADGVPAAGDGPATPRGGAPGLRATPLARRLGREHGLDLSGLAGSGPRGRIQRADIEAALHAAATAAGISAGISAGTAAAAAQAVPAATAPATVRATPPAAPLAAPAAATGSAAGPGPLNAAWLREGTGTPVVLIHGFGAELAAWRPLLPEIPAGRPVLALDLPGHGRSLAHPARDFDAIVAAVEDSLARAGVLRAHLVGHSLGGAVAARIAAGVAVEPASLLLLSPAGLGAEISGFAGRFARATEPAAVAAWLRELVHDPASLPDSLIRTIQRERADGRLAAAQVPLAAALFAGEAQGFSIRADLAGAGCPARIVFGTEDRVFPWRQVLGLPGRIALHLFAATGHMPQLEQRAAMGQILRQMLND